MRLVQHWLKRNKAEAPDEIVKDTLHALDVKCWRISVKQFIALLKKPVMNANSFK